MNHSSVNEFGVIQLHLWDWLEEAAAVAQQMPEQVAVTEGLDALDGMISAMSHCSIPARLAVAAEAFARLSQILEAKAQSWLSAALEDGNDGLVLEPDALAGLVRQPPSFDLSELVEQPALPQRPPRQQTAPDSSLAGPVEPARLVAMLDDLARDRDFLQGQLALFAGDEQPIAWLEVIQRTWNEDNALPFQALLQLSGLDPIELWLALLLGGYLLQAEDDKFYQHNPLVLPLANAARTDTLPNDGSPI